jgi:tripartite-type tricarboxylate transporter receptor subunit TctC
MKLPRREFLHLAGGVAALPALLRIARAQAYPTRPVRIVVGFAAGQAIDIIEAGNEAALLQRTRRASHV